MKFNKSKLLIELKAMVNSHLDYIRSIEKIPDAALNWRASFDSWSVLECLQHLNLYGAFYIPEISKRLSRSKNSDSIEFKSGYWGNKFATDMLPKEDMKTMKTFKSKNPIHSQLDKEIVIDTFMQQQHEFLKLLDFAEHKDLTKTKTALTIPLLKFRLGDTFRFVIYHNERHIVQAKSVLANRK